MNRTTHSSSTATGSYALPFCVRVREAGRVGGFGLKIVHRRLLLQVLAPIEAGIARADLAERALDLAEARLRGRFGDPPSPPHARTRLRPASTLLSATPSTQPAALHGPRKQPCTHKAENRHTHTRARTHTQPRHNTPGTYTCSDALTLAPHVAAGWYATGRGCRHVCRRDGRRGQRRAHRVLARAVRAPHARARGLVRRPPPIRRSLLARQCCA